jgi:hypothetical protein
MKPTASAARSRVRVISLYAHRYRNRRSQIAGTRSRNDSSADTRESSLSVLHANDASLP